MTDEQKAPADEPVNVPSDELENTSTESPNLETEMKPENEPTKPAAPSKESKQKETLSNKGKGTPAPKTETNPTTKGKKDYTFLIMAVVAFALGLLIIYLRNRNKRNAANNAQGIGDNENEQIHDVPHQEQGPDSQFYTGGRNVSNLFDTRSPFENPDYDGRN